MDRNTQQQDDLIDLGSIAGETKGLPLPIDVDEQGSHSGGGLSND